MENRKKKDGPPTVHDMFVAGLEFRLAIQLHREIEQHPEIEDSFWWSLVANYAEQTKPGPSRLQ